MFYPTEACKKRRRRIRFQIMLLEIKKKLTGSLSANDEKKLRQLLQELAIKY